mmetsp:Transcript_73417/g.195110  ORF Transcript_73417/g.195110 Transcript_73417/m.195110 type:complete len:251 (-) Transcript_73417:229-981(-)
MLASSPSCECHSKPMSLTAAAASLRPGLGAPSALVPIDVPIWKSSKSATARTSSLGISKTSPTPSSPLSALMTSLSVCSGASSPPADAASTASRYGWLSPSMSLITTEHRSLTWIVGSTLDASDVLSIGSGLHDHAVLKSEWKRSSSAPYVRPAATTCVRRPVRLLLVTIFSKASSSLKLLCGLRRLYSSSVSAFSGSSASADVRAQVMTEEKPTSTFSPSISFSLAIASSIISAVLPWPSRSSTVSSHS